jgi:hypothetical protein
VTKIAEDRAEQLRRDPEAVVRELDKRLRADLRQTGDFRRVHPLPATGADVPDDPDARLVVLGIDQPYSKEVGNTAEQAAKQILEFRGTTPRLRRNTLAFLAVDKTRLQDLEEATRRYLAWESILAERDTLDLSPHQVKQAETQRASADTTVAARLPEAYQWLLVPVQATPQAKVEWQSFRLSGQDPLAVRAGKRLRNEELLVPLLAGTRLRMELDRIPLWRGDHVAIRQLVEDFATYLYLPRLKEPSVLLAAVRDGLGLLLWINESFAYADSFDEATGRYRGLRAGQRVELSDDHDSGLLVRTEVAWRQMEADSATRDGGVPGSAGISGSAGIPAGTDVTTAATDGGAPGGAPGGGAPGGTPHAPKRYYGTVVLDSMRVGAEAGRVADEVIAHLVGLMGAAVRITLEIEAEIPTGAPENVVRIVTENGRALKFTSHGFETE